MHWDYIIVGAGSAGCTLANRLSGNGERKVLLIEAGGSDRNPLQRIPVAGSLLNFGNKHRDWNYKTYPDPSRNNRVEAWPRGKIMGGSSSMNGMIYVRGHRDDFNHWAALGNKGWGYRDVLPYFKAIENHELSDPEYYGVNGPLKIRQVKGAHLLSHTFVSACSEIGIAPNPHYNAVEQEGVCLLSMTQSKYARHSASQAFLEPIKRRSNLSVMKNTLVSRVLMEGKKAIGVGVTKGRGQREIHIYGAEIILSGGAINSPQLLMLSGIGPADHLQAMGIEVRHHLPGVGQNLHEHPAVHVLAKVNVPTLNVGLKSISLIKYGFDWLLFGKGPLTTVAYQALAFARTDSAIDHPDIQIHFAPMAFTSDENGVRLLDFPCVMLTPNVNRTRSRGYLELNSDSPFDYPAIHPNMLGDDADLNTLIAAGKLCRQVLESSSFSRFVEHEVSPGPQVQTDQQWREFVREDVGPAYHPVGTCKMGIDKMAVVDPSLKVHGIHGLRVIDGSIMPSIISGNTNATCMMIGAKGADMILRENDGKTAVQSGLSKPSARPDHEHGVVGGYR